jgi:hypothetical protein
MQAPKPPHIGLGAPAIHFFLTPVRHNHFLVHAILGVQAALFSLAGGRTPRIAWTSEAGVWIAETS